MPNVLALSGSPSPRSRTASLVRHVGGLVAAEGHTVRHVAARDLPPDALLAGDASHPAVREVIDSITWADALIVGTPVYKAAYSGLLKTLLDLLPQFALAGKTVLPLATGGTPAHVLAIDYALRPVLTSLGTDNVLRGWFVLDRDVTAGADGEGAVAPDSAAGVAEAAGRLITALAAPDSATARVPGLPRGLPTAV
ncbi:hypothetical protein GCM10012287_05570 [Streptomyces daqingensis]|uniref:NADPH-dependent FMN reductase-like domain-containing protein n=1 Tax=Streptomyces daqingensis TaxID=1472640 RepID=A0ABQ2LTG2_9ACTN|nr:NADPH-dependent FMN reductase [Streptomyces daqingensis]GGO43139.1 hypothetical protein GCM10012287_05570 [Streptomyces daqingensis]